MRCAEKVLESARTIADGARLMRVVVVALGKMGLPLATYIARAGPRRRRLRHRRRAPSTRSTRARSPFPGEAGLDEAIADGRRAGAPAREHRHDGRRRRGARPRHRRAAAVRRRARAPGLAHRRRRLRGDRRTACARARRSASRRRCRSARRASGSRRRSRRASGLRAGADFHVVFSPERVSSGRVFRDLDTYPKLVGGLDPEGEARGVALYEQFIAAEVRAMGSAEAAELTKLAETTYRDLNIAYANELARYADRLGPRRAARHRRRQQPALQPHPPARASPSAGTASPSIRTSCWPATRTRGWRASGARSTARCPPTRSTCSPARSASCDGRTILILGVAYRGGVKEHAFSGAAALRDELLARGARALASDPMYSGDDLAAAGYEPWARRAGRRRDRAGRPPRVRDAATPASSAARQVVVDGRGVLDRDAFAAAGVLVLRIGSPPS